MRIAQITTELRPAGAERIVQTLACGLAAAGHEVAVVSLRPLPPASFVLDQLRRANVAVHSLELTKATPWRALRLRPLLRRLRPDLVHAHLIHANLLSRLARLPGVPLVNTVHIAERRPGKWWHLLLDRWTLRRCHVQTAVSHAVATFLAERLGRPAQSFPVVYNGIEPPAPCSPAEVAAWRQEWGVADNAVIIGSVGRLDWQKGYDRLLDVLVELDRMVPEIRNSKSSFAKASSFAFRATEDKTENRSEIRNGDESISGQDEPGFIQGLRRGTQDSQDNHRTPSEALGLGAPSPSSASPAPSGSSRPTPGSSPAASPDPAERGAGSHAGSPWAVVIIGEGPERARLERQAKALDLRNLVVRMPGFRADADRAMGAFDLFVMPSRYEGFGLTLIEAMSHGLPIVASDADSLPELLVGYKPGAIVSFAAGQEQAVAATILKAIADPRPEPASASPCAPGGRFAAGRMTADYLRLYEQVINSQSHAAE